MQSSSAILDKSGKRAQLMGFERPNDIDERAMDWKDIDDIKILENTLRDLADRMDDLNMQKTLNHEISCREAIRHLISIICWYNLSFRHFTHLGAMGQKVQDDRFKSLSGSQLQPPMSGHDERVWLLITSAATADILNRVHLRHAGRVPGDDSGQRWMHNLSRMPQIFRQWACQPDAEQLNSDITVAEIYKGKLQFGALLMSLFPVVDQSV